MAVVTCIAGQWASSFVVGLFGLGGGGFVQVEPMKRVLDILDLLPSNVECDY